MFEITPADIALLNDDDLRSLVALLCEEEVKKCGFSTAAVTWGGNQNSADAGVDVRISLSSDKQIEGFIPHINTCLQVKAQNMPASKIQKEMCPDGRLRPAIAELGDEGGAYIIVSSKGSVSDSALQNRRNAMRRTLRSLKNHDLIKTDFYDRTRIATWVRSHLGLALWVREKAGRPLRGWHPYGAWAHDPGSNYLLDDKIRVRFGGSHGHTSALDAIQRLRKILSTPTSVVRLVGLSGVGKTRFVQTLFDDRVGAQSLPHSLAFYANMADDPEPQPVALASDLLARGDPAVLVVDNCGPELHRRISEVCRTAGSHLSALTVEYDIKEDQPEGTEVVKLERASDELIQRLLKARFPSLSAVDVRTIAEFSDGNARVAIALAGTVGHNESVASLHDQELFRRLFQQRNDPNESLLSVAQACSLVYSFDGQDLSAAGELTTLGSLIGKTPEEMYRYLAELLRRELAQQRGPWRAILPHAIANRLASTALQNLPVPLVTERLVRKGSERLARSFSRRLGYLHNSKEAQQIVAQWLAPTDMLGDLSAVNDLGKVMFENVAPVSPSLTLATIERYFVISEGTSGHTKTYTELLRKLAYDPPLFDGAVKLLVKVVEMQGAPQDFNKSEPLRSLESLFYIAYSGTRASLEQRLFLIESLIFSEESKRSVIGAVALQAALKSSHFELWHEYDFGARSRDYGYWPKSRYEIENWFTSVLALAGRVAASTRLPAERVRAAVANEIDALWNKMQVYDAVEAFCRHISKSQFWPEGWIAVRRALNSANTEESRSRLKRLQELLAPSNLVQQVRAIVLGTGRHLDYVDLDNVDAGANNLLARMQQAETKAFELGKFVAIEEATFSQLAPDLVKPGARLFAFGRGLAQASERRGQIWTEFIHKLQGMDPQQNVSLQAICGFIQAAQEADQTTAHVFLDEALQTEAMANYYPQLESATVADQRTIERLLLSLKSEKVPTEAYRQLTWGRAIDSIPAEDLSTFLLELSRKGGAFVAVDILWSRINRRVEKDVPLEESLLIAGRTILNSLRIGKTGLHDDYTLGEVIKICLSGSEQHASIAHDLSSRLKVFIARRITFSSIHHHIVESLLLAQPKATLDGLLAGESHRDIGIEILEDANLESKGNPLDKVSVDAILSWCNNEPAIRYPVIARVITVGREIDKVQPLKMSEISKRLIEKAPDPIPVIKALLSQLVDLSGWAGSLASTIERNTTGILDELQRFPNAAVAQYATEERARIAEQINKLRHSEEQEDRFRDERFE